MNKKTTISEVTAEMACERSCIYKYHTPIIYCQYHLCFNSGLYYFLKVVCSSEFVEMIVMDIFPSEMNIHIFPYKQILLRSVISMCFLFVNSNLIHSMVLHIYFFFLVIPYLLV